MYITAVDSIRGGIRQVPHRARPLHEDPAIGELQPTERRWSQVAPAGPYLRTAQLVAFPQTSSFLVTG